MNGWTGGQYSVFRVALGATLVWRLAALAAGGTGGVRWLAASGALCALALAAGWRDRIAAWVLIVVSALLMTSVPGLPTVPGISIGALLLVHALLPSAPYGSVDARGRPDPSGRWRFPGPLLLAIRSLVAVSLLWLAIGTDAAVALDDPMPLLLFAVLSVDPAWIRPRRFDGGAPRVYYDGSCGLCHTTVRFLLSEDRGGEIRYAPFASESFASERDLPEDLPDSVIVRVGDRLLVRSAGVLVLGEACGGLWRVLALVVGLVPRPLLDFAYDRVAAARQRLFRRPDGLCPIVPPALRARFLP